MWQPVSFSSSILPVFVPDGGRKGSFDIIQHHKSYAKKSGSLYQKRGLFVLWMLYVGPGWSWDNRGGQRNKKEAASGPSTGQLYSKVERKQSIARSLDFCYGL